MTISTKPRTTKKAQLTKLLGAKAGADIATLSDKLGWQHHTTRAAMSDLCKDGFTIIGTKPSDGGLAKYRIHSEPAATSEVSNGA
ncbi:DUF3489 domain-containing protein [Planktotalea sp.]|uniref:DUF3489 domain-containing protein n=1 Tax=Planktotalea sp. TaxID=2029877 RepID=UPI0025E43BA8|nr:DUF3489 domain-containing protein [Planktotalea sp.]